MKFTNDVAKNIIMLRNEYHLTQIELGEIAGKSDKTVSSWENGTRSPHLRTVKRIAKHFGIDPIALAGESKDKQDIELTDEEKAHILALRSMNEKARKDIFERTEATAATFPRKDAPALNRATS